MNNVRELDKNAFIELHFTESKKSKTKNDHFPFVFIILICS